MKTRFSVCALFLLFAAFFFQVACASKKAENGGTSDIANVLTENKAGENIDGENSAGDLGIASISAPNKTEGQSNNDVSDDGDESYDDDDGLAIASLSNDKYPADEGLDWALKEKKPVCAYCRLKSDCESGTCYFGRCVLGGIHQPHSVRRCFQALNGRRSRGGKECDICRSHRECDTRYCRFGRCLYRGILRQLSIITCFRDSYIEKC